MCFTLTDFVADKTAAVLSCQAADDHSAHKQNQALPL